MSIGSSGRIVIEVSPSFKRQLYAALAMEGMNLKEWFLKSGEKYIAEIGQPSLKFDDNEVQLINDDNSES